MKEKELVASLIGNDSVLEITTPEIKPDVGQYDVIFLPKGILERAGAGREETGYYIQYIQSLLPLLKENGRILLVAENRYGIQNWCGKRETYTNMPFGGFAGCLESIGGRTFSRRKIQDILEGAGLHAYRFYYPVPDYEHAVRVYTDKKLPVTEDVGLLGKQYTKKEASSLLFRDTEVLLDIISNESFPFFANEFMIEAAKIPESLEQNKNVYEELETKKKNGTDVKGSEEAVWSVMRKNRRLLSDTGYSKIARECQDQSLINQVMEIQLDLLRKLKQVCDKHNFQLYAIYGTLLGAVRHGGIIPGDDDIDVALPRKDYEQLLHLTKEFDNPYFLQTPWNDNCFFGGYIKLRNRNTTAIHPQNWWVECCEGIGIDIFPLDFGYCNVMKEKWKEKRICFYQRLLYAKAYGYFPRFQDMPMLLWKAYKYLGLLLDKQKLLDRMNTIMAAGDKKKESPFGIFAQYRQGDGFTKLSQSAFADSIQVEYEDLLLEAPIGYDKILKKKYGEEYMRFPYWSESIVRHGFYAVDIPYQKYKKRFAGLLHPAPAGKEIVVFADDTVIDLYLEWYGKKHPPGCIVSLKKGCLPDKIKGIPVVDFEEYRSSDKMDMYVIICSIYIRGMEKKMQDAGYSNYYFFTGNREWMLLENPSHIASERKKI